MDELVLDIQKHSINNRLIYTVQVIHQAHRHSSFSIGGDTFVASNGFKLLSTGYPMLYCVNSYKPPIIVKGEHISGAGASTSSIMFMCVRGNETYSDDNIIYIDSPLYIERLKQAVKEYNIVMLLTH